MTRTRHPYEGLMVLALIASACGGAPTSDATEESAMSEATRGAESSGNSAFLVDPLWPMALPNDWMFGNVVGVAVDSQDNVWVAHRPRSQNGSEGTPVVLAFDQDGNVVKSWGSKDSIPEWGTQEHGLYIDYRDNVWVGFGGGLPYDINTRATTDNAHFLKLSPDGELLLSVGEFGMGTEGSNSTTYLGQPTDVYVDPETNEAFIADGYTNRRIIVVDADTGEYKRHWGAYGNQPDDVRSQTMAFRRTADGPQPQQFNTPHCLAGADDGLLYVCDRGNQRIQIFQRDGTFVSDAFLKTADDDGPGPAPQDMDFSRDPEQRQLFVIGGGKVFAIDRETMEVTVVFGRRGRQAGQFLSAHSGTLDSQGNLYVTETLDGSRIQKFVRQ
jgi:hypothetical protein